MILRRGGEKLKNCGGTPRPLSRRSRGLETLAKRRNLDGVGGWAAERWPTQLPPGRLAAQAGGAEPRAKRSSHATHRSRARSGGASEAHRAHADEASVASLGENARGRKEHRRERSEARKGAWERSAGAAARRGRGCGRAGRRINKAAVRRYRSARRARSSPNEECLTGGNEATERKTRSVAINLSRHNSHCACKGGKEGGGRSSPTPSPLRNTIKAVMFNCEA